MLTESWKASWAVAAGILLALALVLALRDPAPSFASSYCSPVVTSAGPGYSKAAVFVVEGRADCETARRVIWKALSATPYHRRRILGWGCKSTTRGGPSGVFGALCEKDGEAGREVVKSTVPRRCPGCHGIRN